MIQNISYSAFFERVRKRLENDYASAEFTVTDGELALYTYEAIATVITATAKQQYAVEGIYTAPEGFLTTFKIPASTFVKDHDNNTYTVALPQPPVNLPLGYSIKAPYMAANGGRSMPLIAINDYNKGYALSMACPDGIYYEVEGSEMKFRTEPAFDLITSGFKLYVPMLSSRPKNGLDTDTINVPDDAMAMVFDMVTNKMLGRVNTPKDAAIDLSNKKTEAA